MLEELEEAEKEREEELSGGEEGETGRNRRPPPIPEIGESPGSAAVPKKRCRTTMGFPRTLETVLEKNTDESGLNVMEFVDAEVQTEPDQVHSVYSRKRKYSVAILPLFLQSETPEVEPKEDFRIETDTMFSDVSGSNCF